MPTLNKTILIGHLGQDPELKYTTSGKAVCNFSIATTYNDQTEWHKIVSWNKSAEFAGNYLHKGSLVYVEGRTQSRSWEDRDGNKRYTTEIIATTLLSLDSKSRKEEPQKPDDDTPF